MELTFRQGIVRHQTNIAGTATFLRKAGSSDEYIDLVCDEDPLIFTIAHGNNNYLIEESKSVNQAWGPFAATGQTQYLYWDISLLNATLTRSYTLISPYFGTNEPAAPIAIDQHWFDSTSKTMKVWNGSKWLPKLRVFAATYDSNAILIPRPRGSQVNLVEATKAGNIVLGKNGSPLRDTDGTFVTSESDLISAFTSGENVKLEGMQLYGEALEFIPKFSLVTFDAPGKVKLASGLRPNEIVNGIMTTEYFPGEIGNIVSAGIVRNDQWSFTHVQANEPLFCGPNGEITLIAPNLPEHWYIGYVYDATSIVVNIQKRGATNSAGPASVGIELEGDVIAAGISSAPITAALSTTGVTAGTYNNVTVDVKGRVSNGSNAPYLIANELITVTGDVLGQGSTAIPLTLVNSGVTAGTYNEVTVDSKGRVIAGSTIPFSSINPLLTNFNDGSNTTISNWSTKVIQFDNSFVGSSTGLGTVSNPGDIVLGLRDSGVAAGTYNSVTVDLKGRVVAASNVSYSQTTDLSGDVIGSGIGSVITTLSLTGITPGIYNSVTVDAKGRITAGTVESYATPVTLTGSVNGTGTGTINTTLSATGVVAGSYNNFIVGIDGRITSASNVSYDQNVVLSGDITGSGIGSISTTLSDTGVTPGTYNSLTVDSKGRITAATVEAPFTPSTTLNGDVTGNGIGTLTTSLSLTGVSAGTYNSVTVDAKGRVTSGTIENYQFPTTLTGDVTGTGTGTFATSLSNTGVIPGTYNSVTVDAKGRVTSASIAAVSGVQYLPDLLDVTVTSPTTNQSLLWTGTEWNNATLDRIVSADSSIIISDSLQSIVHKINNQSLVITTPVTTQIGEQIDASFWYALFDDGNVMTTDHTVVATDVVTTSSGNIVIAGYSKNGGSTSAIQNHGFVVMYNQYGVVQWQKSFQSSFTVSNQTSNATIISPLTIDSSDNLYIVVSGNGVSSVLKLSPTGSIVWQTGIDTNWSSIDVFDLIVSSTGNVYFSGYTTAGLGIIAGLNSSGTYMFQKNTYYLRGRSLGINGSELIIGGSLYDSTLDDTYPTLVRFDLLTGAFIAQQNIYISSYQDYVDMKINGGVAYLLASKTLNNLETLLLFAYDASTFSLLNCVRIGDIADSRLMHGSGLSLDASGNIYILGYEGPNSNDPTNQMIILKFDSSFNSIWQRSFGSTNYLDKVSNYNGIVTHGNSVYVVGHTEDNYTSEAFVLKYPQDGSITGTYGTYSIGTLSKVVTTQTYLPTAVTTISPDNGTATIGGLAIASAQTGVSHLQKLSSSFSYALDLYSELRAKGEAGSSGQILMSAGIGDTPYWADLPVSAPTAPTAGTMISVTGNTVSLAKTLLSDFHHNLIVGTSNIAYGNSIIENVGFGHGVLDAITGYEFSTNQGNTAIGAYSLGGSGGSYNTGVGGYSLQIGGNSGYNTAVGYRALNKCNGGGSNVAIGYQALQSTTGYSNVAIGQNTMGGTTSGNNNVAIGEQALSGSFSGSSYNIAIGQNAILSGAGGNYNIALGSMAGRVLNGTSANNVAIGQDALYNTSSGINNIAIGYQTLRANTTGGSNTALGYQALLANAAFTNTTGLGNGATVTASNQVQLGNSTTTTYAYGAVANRSDSRDKAEVRDTILGLEFISALRPVDFKWNYREDYRVFNEDGSITELPQDGSKIRTRYHHGLIAQEVKQVLTNKGIDFGGYQDHAIAGGEDVLSLGYEELIAPMIKAIQELKATVDAQAVQIAALLAK